jgi:hypothetical protein
VAEGGAGGQRKLRRFNSKSLELFKQVVADTATSSASVCRAAA